MPSSRSAIASLALCLPLLLAGCGDSDDVGSGAEPTSSGTTEAAPALAPEGSTSRSVAYRCASGREATLAVDVPDLRGLATTLNRIQPCEYDDGFESGTVTLACPSGPVVVRLRGSDGRVVQPRESEVDSDC